MLTSLGKSRILTNENIDEDLEEENLEEESVIEWSNLIFLPFHPVFKLIVLLCVIIKSILGPIQSVYPIVYCWDSMDFNPYLILIKYYYWYCCDYIYSIDTFLHIVHRQVTDKAMRREHLPKSAFFLLLDIISLIPFYRLVVSDVCPPAQIWPNILAFTEFVIIYRVVEYFSLVTTHSFWNIVTGFTLMLSSTINCIACFWILQTRHGLCRNCNDAIYDWRNFVMHKLNETDKEFATYVYGASYVLSFTINRSFDETKPSTLQEFVVISMFMVSGYLLLIYVVLPKLFAEAILRFRKVCTYYSNVRRLINESRRRNTSPTAYINVENFYKLMWRKRRGITFLPEIFSSLPRSLRLDIRQDLVWPIFYHSPTLRKTSTCFKRFLCELIRFDYKLPGEKFFAGIHCQTYVYYIKSGVVQILSADDGVTPILSVTGGTIFGDVNFLIPPLRRKVTVRCLTYCEVYCLTRYDLIRAMHTYPEDGHKIMISTNERIQHARTLHSCKQKIKGPDRSEVESIAWIKRRWWEISNVISDWKKKSSKKDQIKCELPPEESSYHCAKYIGQLVLCTNAQLQTKSMFTNDKFPWILVPYSSFGTIWHRIVACTVLMVLILYPPYITMNKMPKLFKFFQIWTDFVYITDICVSISTSLSKQENITNSFVTVIFARFKSLNFLLDVLSTIWIEQLAVAVGKPEFYYIVQFNRLIKIYIFFKGEFVNWAVTKNPLISICFKLGLIQFCLIFILSYLMYVCDRNIDDLTTSYFFGGSFCKTNTTKMECDPSAGGVFNIAISWTFELLFYEYLPKRLIDIYFATGIGVLSFMTYAFCQSRFIALLYLKYRDLTNYQYFVSNLTKFYKYYKIHQDLLRRLNRYLICHWKYYHGMDVLQPNMLKDEPYDIFWKVHGEVAEKIISQSRAFERADPALIRELANATKFVIVPKNSTVLLFGVECKNVTWIVQGHIKCEYHNENGDLVNKLHNPGHLLSVKSVFLGKASLRTYSACTDCEVLFLKIQDFFKIIKRYPNEWSYFENCIREFGPTFDDIFQNYLKKYKNYQKKLRERIFHAKLSIASSQIDESNVSNSCPYAGDIWSEPESKFIEYWMFFRSIIVFTSIACTSLQGGAGVTQRRILVLICLFCDCVALMDICVKLFLAYYDEKGILITDKRKCLMHYLTRGFVLDIIGALPWIEAIKPLLSIDVDDNSTMLINTFSKFSHLYILFGYFSYIADFPTNNVAYVMIVKWQVVLILIMLSGSHFLMSYCVVYTFDDKLSLIHTKSLNTCWLPKFFELNDEPNEDQLQFLVAQSFNLVQCGFVRFNFGRFYINAIDLGVGAGLVLVGILFWFVVGYSLAMLILNSRGHTLFLHGIDQLKRFLKAERVDSKLIHQAIHHFRYWWIRTKGINIHHLTNERIGVVLRQDLSYYFYRKTYLALKTILQGDESLGRQLASASSLLYFLPGQQITREMDLVPWVYIVHRGKVTLSNNGEKKITLTKGGIFGQLHGMIPRPIRISVTADGHADLLQITIKQFQDYINDEVRENIANNPQSQYDFMATKKYVPENPYNTIQYILRGRKSIRLPWMDSPLDARHGNSYSKWLYLSWWLGPVISAFIVLVLNTFPLSLIRQASLALFVLDVLFLANFIAEFYTVKLTIIDNEVVHRRMGFRQFKQWGFYADLASLVIPLISLITDVWTYQLARLIRLRLLYDFHKIFCKSFKSKVTPVLLNLTIVVLLLHAMTCGWIYVACRGEFPIQFDIHEEINITIDYDQWAFPKDRYGGCSRLTKNFRPHDSRKPSFVVPKAWQNDYIVALTYIILIQTHTSLDAVMALTLSQVYYKVVINALIYLLDIFITSAGISYVYTRFRELYEYDYNVNSLIIYLSHNDLSPDLLESVKIYTKELWRRQRGNWLPELAASAPLCIREDLFGALYMHHLNSPPLFRQLPPYFSRQLVARLHRIVIFPGKCIVKEGDVFACMYFIHEGEVEKWFIDKSGDSKMVSLLTVNGYFGLIPGLFPNIAYQFTYYTRTVVDLVYLKLRDWQDLLDSYPDVKRTLYAGAKQLKKDLGK